MGYIVKGGSSVEYAPPPEDLHRAVCVDIVDKGEMESGPDKKLRPKVRLVWELDPDSAGFRDDGKRHIVGRLYTASLNEKATLRKDLESWRGRVFTVEELGGFDLDNVLDKPCRILVKHNTKEDRTYANVDSVMKSTGSPLAASGEYVREQDRPADNGSGGGMSAAEYDAGVVGADGETERERMDREAAESLSEIPF